MSAGSLAASVPAVAAAYFGPSATGQDHPIIEEVFWPGRGWRRHPLRKRVSVNEMRRLRREGATAVALRAAGRLADFQTRELAR